MQLLLPPDDSVTEWTCVDTSGARAPGQAQLQVLALHQLRAGRDAILVVPWQWVSWHRIALPPNSHRQLLAIASNLLEEELLDPIDDLHLSFAPEAMAVARRGGEVWVGVCKAMALDKALQALQSQSCLPARIVPELAPSANATHLLVNWVQGDPHAHRILRHAKGLFAVPANHPFMPDDLPSTDAHAVRAWAEPALVKDAERWLAQAGWSARVEVQTRQDRLIEAAHSPWNLAQGRFKAQAHWQHRARSARQWLLHDAQAKGLRWGLLALLSLQILGVATSAWQDRQERADLQALIDQSFAQALPNTPQLDAPAQMAQALRRLEQQHGIPNAADLGHLLAAWAQLMPPHPIGQFAYQGDELRVQGLSPEALTAAGSAPWSRLGLQGRAQQTAFHLRPLGRQASDSPSVEAKEVLRDQAQQVQTLQARIQTLRQRPTNALQVRTALQTLTPLQANQGEWRFTASEAVLDARQVSTAQLVQWLTDWPAHAQVSVVQAQGLHTNSGWQVQLSARLPTP